MAYSYPIDDYWTTEEIVDVVNFFSAIEKAYEEGIKKDKLMKSFHSFKKVVPSKSEEKQLFKKFEKQSGYAPFPVMKYANTCSDKDVIKLKNA